MAQRRMVSSRVANSAKFLQMPIESQLFYFHLIIRADDDGVVESYPVMKLLGIAPDNMKVLISKDFIRQLNEDQVIVITDWSEHNTIRADRKVDSIYKELLLEKCPEFQIIQAKPRSDVKNNSGRVSDGLSVDGPRTAECSIGKVKLSKGMIVNSPRKISEAFFNDKNQREMMIDKMTGNKVVIRKEVDKFISYWTEPNKSGTRVRWEMEKTFEVYRRLVTWLSRSEIFSKGSDKNPVKTLSDGSRVIEKFGVWVLENDNSIKVDINQYPELKNY